MNKIGKRHIHDMCNTRIYRIWTGIKSRCKYTNDKYHYKHYVSKGVIVCDEWKNDFLKFYEWAMANGYNDNLTIDRINNDGNYEPSNCQWITHKENNNKRGNNRIIEMRGESHTLTEWADLFNMSVDTLASRLTRGWNIEKALTMPVKKKNRKGNK